MANWVYLIVILFITSFHTPEIACNVKHKSLEKTEDNEDDESDWRILGKDEPVRRGSHVKLDLSTGERKIKISEAEKTKNVKTSMIMVKTEEESGKRIDDGLQSRLHRITGDDPIRTDEDDDKMKRKFKSYEELKKDFEDLRMAVKTDIEIMNGILESYRELVDDKVPVTEELQEQQLTMLTDLEYLMHQIDNANEFIKSGGLADVVLPSLNSTSADIRSGTARLLGSAAQSNVAVQVAALESGAIGILLRVLVLDKTPSVRSSALYALSCLVRRFPMAQKKLVDEGGLTVLNNLFNDEASDRLKIQVKVLTFINDLIVEKRDAEKTFMSATNVSSHNATATNIDEAKERLRQYSLIGLETRLQEQKWCDQLSGLLTEHVSQHLDVILADIASSETSTAEISVDHDVIEKVIGAMISSYNLCLSDYESGGDLHKIIRFLYLWYEKLAKAEEDNEDNYFKYVSRIIEIVSWMYKISLRESIKDEL